MNNFIKKILSFSKFGLILLLIAVFFAMSIKTVKEGRVGIQYRLGKLYRYPIQPGVHFSIPLIDYWDVLDMREQVYQINTSAYTKDTQTVERISLKVNYQYDMTKLEKLVKDIGVAYVRDKLVAPQTLSVTKNIVGKYKAEELIAGRSELQETIEDELRKSLNVSGVLVSAVNIEEIDFEDSFEQTIREKVAAEQEALKVKNQTIKIEEEANQQVIAAKGKADAKKIEADANAYEIQKIQEQLSKSPEYNEYIKMQKWDGKLPEIVGDTVNPFVGWSNK